jgi:drug/metabolite transporter (DMT)-like permease
MPQDRTALDAAAFATMVVLCALWGVQQAIIKLTAPDVTLLMQGGLRALAATLLLLLWARRRRIALFDRDGTLIPGIVAGLLFAFEFVFIYAGLGYTGASRMVVFVYLAPIFTALGLHALVPGEQLTPIQWSGALLAFAGVAVAFFDGFSGGASATVAGDLSGVIAALLWAATTVLIRRSSLARATASKTLFYQLAISVPVLLIASRAVGEEGVIIFSPLAVASLTYQALIAFGSLLAWFWLLTRYLATPLSVLSFLTPMFGVLFGVLLLREPLTGYFALAVLLVAGGIVLVNLRR